MSFDEWLDTQIVAFEPYAHFQTMWDRVPIQFRAVKYDWEDDPEIIRARRARQARIKRELEFIAYDCT